MQGVKHMVAFIDRLLGKEHTADEATIARVTAERDQARMDLSRCKEENKKLYYEMERLAKENQKLRSSLGMEGEKITFLGKEGFMDKVTLPFMKKKGAQTSGFPYDKNSGV